MSVRPDKDALIRVINIYCDKMISSEFVYFVISGAECRIKQYNSIYCAADRH